MSRVNAKWTPHYKTSMKRWYDNWDAITPIFKFSLEVTIHSRLVQGLRTLVFDEDFRAA